MVMSSSSLLPLAPMWIVPHGKGPVAEVPDARLQSAAEPGGVATGPGTWRACRDYFELIESEPLELKARPTPCRPWQARFSVRGGVA